MKKKALTNSEIKFIRSSNKNRAELSALFDRSISTIRRIQTGMSYPRVDSDDIAVQELTMVQTPSCHICLYWQRSCTLGKLDVLNNSTDFALDCDYYRKR